VSDEIVMIADRAIAKRKEFERVDMINNLRTFGIDSELSSACETGGGSAKEIAFPVNCFFCELCVEKYRSIQPDVKKNYGGEWRPQIEPFVNISSVGCSVRS
jgi:hypothetical protein